RSLAFALEEQAQIASARGEDEAAERAVFGAIVRRRAACARDPGRKDYVQELGISLGVAGRVVGAARRLDLLHEAYAVLSGLGERRGARAPLAEVALELAAAKPGEVERQRLTAQAEALAAALEQDGDAAAAAKLRRRLAADGMTT